MSFSKYAIIFISIVLTSLLFQNCGEKGFQTRMPDSLQLTSENLNSELEIPDSEDSFPHLPDQPSNPIISPSPGGKLYYVSKNGNDSNGLTQITAFRTIQKAADAVSAGDTVVVLPGIYKEAIVSTKHGTASARIRFVSQQKWGAKIAPTATTEKTFWRSWGDYTDIEGFSLDGRLGGINDYTSGVGLSVRGNHSRIMHNYVHFFRACNEKQYFTSGIGIGTIGYLTNFNTEIHSNIIRNTRVKDCALLPKPSTVSGANMYLGTETAGYGIYFSTPQGKVYNNIIFGFRIGIHLWHNPTDTVISHNLIFDTGNLYEKARGVGIIFGCGDKPFVTCKNINVANNIFMHNQGVYAIREYGANVQGSNKVLNNILFMNTSNSIVSKDTPKIIGVSGNLIGTDPRLVNYKQDGNGDYRLTAQSPAIDAASSMGTVLKDINLANRPNGKTDIGPYEY